MGSDINEEGLYGVTCGMVARQFGYQTDLGIDTSEECGCVCVCEKRREGDFIVGLGEVEGENA